MSSNIPQPVPSKAAIRALRGLVLGTSCTLALVTEDRRRRINAARSAIRNGDRIRSARQYHEGGSSFAIALEEESFAPEPEMVHWNTNGVQRANGTSSPPATSTSTSTSSSQPSPPPKTKTKVPPGLLGWPSKGPSFQKTTIQTKRLLDESLSSSSIVAALKTPANPTDQTAKRTEQQPADEPAAAVSPASTSPPPEILHAPKPSLAKRAAEYKTRAQVLQAPAAPPALSLEAASARIVELTDPTSVSHLQEAVKTFALAVATAKSKPDNSPDQLQSLWRASASLCVACQEANSLDLAQEVLRLAVESEQLDEDLYFAHNPFPVVKSIVSPEEVQALSSESGSPASDVAATRAVDSTPADKSAKRNALLKRLRLAREMFHPTFKSSKKHPESEVLSVARHLLACAFGAEQQKSIRGVYASTLLHLDDVTEFTCWYITRLRESQSYKAAVWAFLARPPTASLLSDEQFFQLGDIVTEAVRLSSPSKAKQVFGALLQLCASSSSDWQLRTTWVTELLYSQWTSTQDFKQVRGMFGRVSNNGSVSKSVRHKDGLYRVMIQISLEAEMPDEAQKYFDEVISLDASAANDVRLLGLFALAKAKQGDWQGVHNDFQTAATGKNGLSTREAELAFVPIAKEYIRTHSIGESEVFVMSYIDNMKIPLGRQMVTLLSNEYGALREVKSFTGWLDYCAKSGFQVDAAFSNAILLNCRKHWKFRFRDLRTMYRKLLVLNPNFEDNVTKNIMINAAISDGRHGSRPAKARLMSLRVQPTTSGGSSNANSSQFHTQAGTASVGPAVPSPLSTGRYTDLDAVYLAMKQAFKLGNMNKVVRVYKQAERQGVKPNEKCLKLAVAAAVRGGKNHNSTTLWSSDSSTNSSISSASSSPLHPALMPSATQFESAIELLNEASVAGLNIDAAAAYVAIAYIDALGPWMELPGGRKQDVVEGVNSIIAQLEGQNVKISDLALNRAAFHLFKAGHMRGAIAMAFAAADTPMGGGLPGYNVWNFCVLVKACSRLADADGLRMAIRGAATSKHSSNVKSNSMCYKVLKQSRSWLQRYGGHSAGARAALHVVEEGLAQARAAREQLFQEQRELEAATIGIMRQAALDAGCDPVDFDDVPFLHSRRTEKEDEAATATISTTPEQQHQHQHQQTMELSDSWDQLLAASDDEVQGQHKAYNNPPPAAADTAA